MRLPGMGLGRIVLVVAAAVAVFAATQLPFYVVTVPRGLGDALAAQAQTADPQTRQLVDAMTPMLNEGAAQVNAAGGLAVTMWDAFERLGPAVVGLCLIAALLAILGYLGHISGTVARYAWVCGIGAFAIVVYHMVVRPGDAAYVALGSGAWVLAAAALGVAVGGHLSSAKG